MNFQRLSLPLLLLVVVMAIFATASGCTSTPPSSPASELPPHEDATVGSRRPLITFHPPDHFLMTGTHAQTPRHHVLRIDRHSLHRPASASIFARDFDEIHAMLWHEGVLHVMHGPHYTALRAPMNQASAGEREEISVIDRSPESGPEAKLNEDDAQALLATLADRSKSNEHRIDALWKLRSLANRMRHSSDGTAPAAAPAFDPTKAFITALHNGPDALRAEAAKVLRVSSHDASPAIKGLIHRAKNDTHARVRMEAALTLGYLDAKEAVAELLGSLDDPDDRARMAKILAIRRINQWDLAPAFVNAADKRTREGAMLALADMYDEAVVDALDFAVRAGAWPQIRLQAVGLLERAITGPAPASETEQIIAALKHALLDEDDAVKAAAAASLARIEVRRKKHTD